ncbi:MAG: hypothetical protein ABJA75_15925 [Bradyrhizobium sp.]
MRDLPDHPEPPENQCSDAPGPELSRVNPPCGDAFRLIAAWLGRGLALLSADVEPRRSGEIIMTFLKALIASAPPGAGAPSSRTKPAAAAKSPAKRS